MIFSTWTVCNQDGIVLRERSGMERNQQRECRQNKKDPKMFHSLDFHVCPNRTKHSTVFSVFVLPSFDDTAIIFFVFGNSINCRTSFPGVFMVTICVISTVFVSCFCAKNALRWRLEETNKVDPQRKRWLWLWFSTSFSLSPLATFSCVSRLSPSFVA